MKIIHGWKPRKLGGFSLPSYILIHKIMDVKSIPENREIPTVIERFAFIWQGIEISLKWEPEYSLGYIAHLEIESKHNERIPITETGYKAHFCPREIVEAYSNPVDYVQAWMEQEAEKPEWQTYLKTKNIQSLF